VKEILCQRREKHILSLLENSRVAIAIEANKNTLENVFFYVENL